MTYLSCWFKQENSQLVYIDDYKNVSENEDSLLKAVANQLVFVGVDASCHGFQYYIGGVFIQNCGMKPNHAMTIVGYEQTVAGIKYWILRNLWLLLWRGGGGRLHEDAP
ncbi:Vignain [Platanthera zijinensis]|uniref:Vignain n=1 Tax=Platanthera zijinensis TaxID=2320716 RepID=A0AAP0B2G4_9ASPA